MGKFNLTRCETTFEFIRPILARELFKFVIGSILTMVYIRLVYVLIKRRSVFPNVFYKFIIVNGILSISCYIFYFIFGKIPIILFFLSLNHKITEKWTFWISLNMYLVFVTGIGSFIGIFFLCLNRCTLIVGITNANYYWERAFPFVVVFNILLPMILYSGTLFSRSRLIPFCVQEDPSLNIYEFEKKPYFKALNIFDNLLLPIDSTIAILSIIVNSISIRSFWLSRRNGRESRRTVGRYAGNLFFIYFGEFCVQLLCLFMDITKFIYDNIGDEDNSLLEWAIIFENLLEMSTLISCVIIISCSRRIRREVFGLRTIKSHSSSEHQKPIFIKTGNTTK